jgi:cytochrome c oxidase subunit I+III
MPSGLTRWAAWPSSARFSWGSHRTAAGSCTRRLTSRQHSPGLNADFWLLGIGFIEISAIAGAIEIIVGILMTRAPGMTLARMPVYAWAMLVVGFMIVLAFPAVIAGTALLEMERAFNWPFFIAERGGDPLLWQHLFWFFGHPRSTSSSCLPQAWCRR